MSEWIQPDRSAIIEPILTVRKKIFPLRRRIELPTTSRGDRLLWAASMAFILLVIPLYEFTEKEIIDPGDKIPTFRADRPFMFLIMHKETNSILFMGKVEDPTV
ncbi:MAG: serpin family protein [Candidatus Thermoplasmatota archaeon]|nr:serpin family protein [Candidatus Thermoplasmatota archaeon]